MTELTFRFLWDQLYDLKNSQDIDDEEYKIIDDFIFHCTHMSRFKNWERLDKQLEKIKNTKTYLMKDSANGLYKIGRSVNPNVREKTLQGEKATISMVKIWDKNIESELHRMYKKERVRGEWFKLSDIQVKYITTHFL